MGNRYVYSERIPKLLAELTGYSCRKELPHNFVAAPRIIFGVVYRCADTLSGFEDGECRDRAMGPFSDRQRDKRCGYWRLRGGAKAHILLGGYRRI